jgi:hypothetical protein
MPAIITRGAMSARGFGFAGKSLTLTTYTFPSGYSTWTAPSGVTNLVSGVGKGADGSAGYWFPNYASGYSYVVPSSGSGGTSGDWSTIYNEALSIASSYGSGGPRTVTGTYYIRDIWPDNTLSTRITLLYPGTQVDGSATVSALGSGATSGPITYAGGFGGWQVRITTYIDPTTGADTTGFGQIWPGGVGGPATTTTINNIAVTPGSTYGIYNNGSLVITYYA